MDEFANADLENIEIGEESDNHRKPSVLIKRTHPRKNKGKAKVDNIIVPARLPPVRPKALQAEAPRMQASLFFLCYKLTQMNCFLALKESMQHFALIQSLFCCCHFEFATECLGREDENFGNLTILNIFHRTFRVS
eukprot:g53523.t1